MASRKKTQEYLIQVIREQLRRSSSEQAALLSRSVGRMTSYDAEPCTEYGSEVDREYAVIDHLLYIQHCRSTLERCIGSGSARLRYRWRDGRVTETRFRKTSSGRVAVSGLLTQSASEERYSIPLPA